MRHFFLLITIFTLAIGQLPAEKFEDEHITVRLSTESELIPIYFAKFVNDNSGFDNDYLNKLDGILLFDLNHNGMTYTLGRIPERERLANAISTTGHAINTQSWKDLNIFYVIKVHVGNDKTLSAAILSVNGESLKNTSGIKLTGDVLKDRLAMHQLADTIHKALFGTDGIATTHILYSVRKKNGSNSSNWTSEIWESDYDGFNAHPVISDSAYSLQPVYVPPKQGKISGSLFYVSYQSAQPKIFVASLKEGKPQRFSYMSGNQLMPAISRQRDKVAFISDITGNPDLFIQDFSPEEGLKGKPRQIFAGKKATQGTPAFSPNGKQISFVSNKDGSPKVYVIDIPPVGTPLKDIKAKLITRHAQESSAPSWSPDGSKLAYCGKINGVRQIWVYDFNTNEERQLTEGAINKENPSWAPNSLCLVYNTTDNNACELYMINLNQPNATKISSGAGEKRFPNWEPRI